MRKRLLLVHVVNLLIYGMNCSSASIVPVATTHIFTDKDYDTSRPEKQIKYEWRINNRFPSGFAIDLDGDSIIRYTVLDNLAARGMYNIKISSTLGFWNLSFPGGTETSFSFWDHPFNHPIFPNIIGRFSALIDESLIKGDERVQSYAVSRKGQTSRMMEVVVPISIPEPSTIGILFTGVFMIYARRTGLKKRNAGILNKIETAYRQGLTGVFLNGYATDSSSPMILNQFKKRHGVETTVRGRKTLKPRREHT